MKKFIHFLKKHKCCAVIVSILFYFNWDTLLAEIATPIRCKMWEGREFETFLTPEEWRKISGVDHSLKGIEWIDYSSTDPFFKKNEKLFQPIMLLDGKKNELYLVNKNYLYLNIYIYVNPRNYLGHDTYILYDHKLKKMIVRYNRISGYSISKLFGSIGINSCKNNSIASPILYLQNYLN